MLMICRWWSLTTVMLENRTATAAVAVDTTVIVVAVVV